MDKENESDREKALAHIIDDFDKKQKDQHSLEEQALRTVHRQNVARRVLRGCGICFIVILVFYLGMSLIVKKPFIENNYSWLVGSRTLQDYRREGCLFHLWQVRKAIDLYYAQHNEFPSDTDPLYSEGFLAQKIVCPATGARYIIKPGPNGNIFCCPNPAEHGVSQIGAGVAAGSPVIERE